MKKTNALIILVLTIIAIIIVLTLTASFKYNKIIIDKDKWEEIINNRKNSTDIEIKDIQFNDYSLLIDNYNNTIYYSVVDSNTKNNPSIKYKTNKNKIKIVVNDKITEDILENKDILKIMIYDDDSYRIYNLVVTDYPILNIISEDDNSKIKIDIDLEIFDNHLRSARRVIKSKGELRVVKEGMEYSFSLLKDSVGGNERKNNISIFGMEKRDEYVIRKVNNNGMKNEKYVQLFINNKYMGVYSFGPNRERGVNNFERNRENNR